MSTKFFNKLSLKQRRKDLRKNMTKSEVVLWSCLKNKKLGFKFRRQFSIDKFIVDFYCPEKNLIIEIDGISHDGKYDYDVNRQKFLEDKGFKVIRFTTDDVFENLENVLVSIKEELEKQKPSVKFNSTNGVEKARYDIILPIDKI